MIFRITNPELLERLGVSTNTELDIKVLYNPKEVADLKKKVFDFFGFYSPIPFTIT
jgi:hypothetical protein